MLRYTNLICDSFYCVFVFCRFKTLHCFLYPLTSWCSRAWKQFPESHWKKPLTQSYTLRTRIMCPRVPVTMFHTLSVSLCPCVTWCLFIHKHWFKKIFQKSVCQRSEHLRLIISSIIYPHSLTRTSGSAGWSSLWARLPLDEYVFIDPWFFRLYECKMLLHSEVSWLLIFTFILACWSVQYSLS